MIIITAFSNRNITSRYWCTQAVLSAPGRGDDFGVKYGEGNWVERKGSTASSRHHYSKGIAVVQQSNMHASCAAWLKGIWVLIAFPVPLSADSGAASSACSRDTEIVLLSRQSASVRDPNEQ